VQLEVVDDGQGFSPSGRSSGLRNMAARAEAHGGSCTVIDRVARGDDESGTALCWRVPLRSS
jgi:signal transduction histidine kinase